MPLDNSYAAPILTKVVATGAGAALVLDFIGYVRANKLVAARPVSLFYSSASLPLLQFVTNSLLAERIPGIDIKTALTSHDDLKVRLRVAFRRVVRCLSEPLKRMARSILHVSCNTRSI